MHLIVGPPASGKTTRLLEVAHDWLRKRKRVWWVCLPFQKAYVYRQVTKGGAVLGLEVLSSQQLYYRLLAATLAIRPILTGPGRVALVGEALGLVGGAPPSPGEARLFARAIAEAKRNGVGPSGIPGASPEARRLREVYAHYETLKATWGRFDYDDFRQEATRLLESSHPRLEADAVIVDGFRELGVLELRFFQALSRHVPVYLSLREAPPGLTPQEVRSAGSVRLQAHRAPNPVSEARWVLRAIKRDLAQGLSPLEVAVVAPENRIPAWLTLADEYGLPLVDQRAPTAADTPEGRLLLEMLELPDFPTPGRLMALPELAPLGRVALERGLVGLEAVSRLARELGLEGVWTAWMARLRSPGEGGGGRSELEWAEELLDALPEVRNSPRRARLLERAQEAHRIAQGAHFRRWWAALLSESYEPHRPNGGVALLTPTLASGQRWKKLYLTHAVEGAYSAGEMEDYFVPEELRVGLEEALQASGLPRRMLGRDPVLLEELRTRAEEVVVTYPEASQEGPLVPEPALVGPAPSPLPALPPASPLEVAGVQPYQAAWGTVSLPSPTVEDLRRYQECPMRYWAGLFLPEEPPWWQILRRELRRIRGKLLPARLEALSQQFPQARDWMEQHAGLLGSLELGFSLAVDGLEVRLDGVRRQGKEAHIYCFLAPDTSKEEAQRRMRERWSERWMAGHLLEKYKGRIQQAHLWAWPVLGEAWLLDSIERVDKSLRNLHRTVQETHQRYAAGVVEPNPGFICRDCKAKDICREGQAAYAGPGLLRRSR
ncbi:ATP-dependent nuclease subunit B [Meiothermus sp. QL-1]|uniref:ATP-dependent nuclease subunit B n=1 Tax=Meiothermus sp. QL-1 TaxID=2058095 RepID=UPI000E0C2FB6|nr:ATP-dependent nuclease subunit B [Meiothermus sp. QL-1]RDI95535.1 ATP-dependent nuclease subunit B [Meiothermus sp. QL-1]